MNNLSYMKTEPKQDDFDNVVYINTPKMKNDGTPKETHCNKQKGRKSEVFAFEIEDMKKIIGYFQNNNLWIHYLCFVLSCNLARRVGDTLALTWKNFFNPETGKIRSDILEIEEDKTDKIANPHINSACRAAISLYCEKTGCNPAENDYSNPVFLQMTGNYKGRVLSYSSYYKKVKEAGKECGLEYNVGAHSPRKTFGMIGKMIHPGDNNSMEILQSIFNHSSESVTRKYIGLTKKKIDAYYEDMGDFFNEYVIEGKEYGNEPNSPIVSLDMNDLREIITAAYDAGMNNSGSENTVEHIEAINAIMALVDQKRR